ncbi:hypothetical protein PHET_05857 [Paragonimus heterotremus]|uniref:Uncharacterized protein n=1 Tax=Paragonimus heterotremus TaxID=100268 RepID=A0A8J4TFM9_9TREM|nr:hypothetical protein PHET_05857 [Paragonimus heterotremus]
MSLAPGVSGPLHVCRRLFGEATYTRVQQTMEAVIRKDAERFTKIWNFPLIPRLASEPRQPLSQLNVDQNPNDVKSADAPEVNRCCWQQIQPEAVFYITPPRKLKAYRRLTPSVAQKARMELMNIQTRTTVTNLSHIPSSQSMQTIEPNTVSDKQDSIGDLFQPLRNPESVLKTTVVPGEHIVPRTPILIRPSSTNTTLRLPYLEQLKNTEAVTMKTPASEPKHRLTLVRSSRYSEQINKRRSGAKVTDYFAISKRARQSMK